MLAGCGLAGEMLIRLTADEDGVRVLVTSEEPAARGLQSLIRIQTQLAEVTFAADAELGGRLAPSRRDRIETVDFSYTLVSDSTGFPNREPWPRQPDVALLGNSLILGVGVGMEGQLASLLEQRLEGRTVLNLAVPGGGTQHELLVYRRFVEPLRPRLVIATLWVVWDIDNSNQFEHWVREGKPNPDYKDYRYTFNETHASRGGAGGAGRGAEPSTLGRSVRFARRQLGRSALLRSARDAAAAVVAPGTAVLVRFPSGQDLLLSTRESERLTRGITRQGAPHIEETFFAPLEQLRAEVEASGSRFVIALVPSKEELYGAETTPEILRSIDEIRAGLQARDLAVLDLYPVFVERGTRSPPFYHADMHLNPLGNEIVADAMAEWIAAEGVFAAR